MDIVHGRGHKSFSERVRVRQSEKKIVTEEGCEQEIIGPSNTGSGNKQKQEKEAKGGVKGRHDSLGMLLLMKEHG